MAELIIVTGGSCSGKTSLIAALRGRGHDVLGESAYEVIEELIDELGVAGQMAWRRKQQVEFQRRITRRQHEREQAARRSSAPYVFCDRGLLDGKAYCRLAGVPWPDDLETLAASARYAHVFVLDTLHGFDPRPETGRFGSRDDSKRVGCDLEAIYRAHADRITRLPERPIDERAEALLRGLGASSKEN